MYAVAVQTQPVRGGGGSTVRRRSRQWTERGQISPVTDGGMMRAATTAAREPAASGRDGLTDGRDIRAVIARGAHRFRDV